eukprot:jgi/Ulvmu1/1071/UM105_0030.1
MRPHWRRHASCLHVQRKQCFWIGAPDRWRKFEYMAATTAVSPTFMLAKHMAGVAVKLNSDYTQRSRRCVGRSGAPGVVTPPTVHPVIIHAACMQGSIRDPTCHPAVPPQQGAIALSKLLSDYKTATSTSSTAAASLSKEAFRRDVAFTAVLCMLSVATFAVSTMDMRNVMRAVRETAQHVSSRLSAALLALRHSREFGGWSGAMLCIHAKAWTGSAAWTCQWA